MTGCGSAKDHLGEGQVELLVVSALAAHALFVGRGDDLLPELDGDSAVGFLSVGAALGYRVAGVGVHLDSEVDVLEERRDVALADAVLAEGRDLVERRAGDAVLRYRDAVGGYRVGYFLRAREVDALHLSDRRVVGMAR